MKQLPGELEEAIASGWLPEKRNRIPRKLISYSDIRGAAADDE